MATITGTPGGDNLHGTQGNDLIRGFAGNDILNAGPGFDTLVGGTGADTFVLTYNANGSVDPVSLTDFAPREGDRISFRVLPPRPPNPEASRRPGNVPGRPPDDSLIGDLLNNIDLPGSPDNPPDQSGTIYDSLTRDLLFDIDSLGPLDNSFDQSGITYDSLTGDLLLDIDGTGAENLVPIAKLPVGLGITDENISISDGIALDSSSLTATSIIDSTALDSSLINLSVSDTTALGF